MRRSTCIMVVGWFVASTEAISPAFARPLLPALKLPDVAPKEPVRSAVQLLVGLELAWAKQTFEERVPKLLYQQSNREISRGIWLDARVSRGAIDLRIADDRATVLVPIELLIDVRSKLGPLVVQLGQCHSTIDVELTLLSSLSADGRLPRPTGKASTREPCRLSGFDVTPFIQREIEQQVAAGEEQATEQLSRINGVISEIHADLFWRLSQNDGGCLRFVPEKLQQSPFVVDQGIAITRFVVDGAVTNACQPLPPPSIVVEQTTTPRSFDLAWSRRIALKELGELLAQRFVARAINGASVKVRAVHRDDGDQLAFGILLPKLAGWVLVRPTIVEQKLILTDLSSKDPELLRIVRPSIEETVLPVDTVALELLTRKLVTEANDATQVFGQSPGLKERYQTRESALRTALDVFVDPDAVIVVVRQR